MSICAWPDIITTGACTPCVFKSSSSARPSRFGITTSERIRSKGRDSASSSARAELSQTVASCPARRNARESEASVFASSSTIRMSAFAVVLTPSLPSVRSQRQNRRRAWARSIINVVPCPRSLTTLMLP